MKRLLAFLLIFGSGLGLLLYLQGRSNERPREGVSGPPGTTGQAETELITVPDEIQVLAPPGPEQPVMEEPVVETIPTELGGVRGSISGPIVYRRFLEEDVDRSTALFRLSARDSYTAEDGRLELTEVVLDHFDRGKVVGASGRVLAGMHDGQLTLGGGDDGIELDAARIDLPTEHPFAPLSLTGGKLIGNLAGQRFELTAAADGTGAPHLESARFGLDAERLTAFLETGALAASGAARLELSNASGEARRTLFAEELTIEEGLAGRVVLDARGSEQQPAVLTLAGAKPAEDLVLRAPHLVLVARRLSADELLLESLVVDGRGQVERSGGVASGEDLDFLFSKDGKAGRVILSGSPSLTFPDVRSSGLTTAPSDLVLEASGPLSLALDGDLEFQTDAASRLSWGELTLDTLGGLEGEALEGATRIGLRGRGGVTLQGILPTPRDLVDRGAPSSGQLTYTTETVDLDYSVPVDPVTLAPVPAGAMLVELVGTGRTSILAVDPAGQRANITCGDGLTLRIEGDRWTAPRGRDVELSLEVESGTYSGHADELLGLDPTALRLDARGGAFLERRGEPPYEHRSGQGARIVLDGEDQLQIQGSPTARARYEEGGSFVEATRFERLGSNLSATGEVVTHLELDGLVLDFQCGGLDLRGLDPEAGTAERLELRQGVEGEVLLGAEALQLSTRRLELLRIDELVALPDGQAPTARYELHGTGPVALGWSNDQADWKVDCDRLDVYAEEPPADAVTPEGDLWFELIARDNVRVRDELGGFVGHGDVLHLDHASLDRTLLEGGEEPARVAGQLPGLTGSQVSYKGRVSRLSLLERSLEAEDVDLILSGLSLPGSKAGEDGEWTARCDTLKAEVGSVALEGGVRFEGRDQQTVVEFSADRAAFVNAELLATPGAPLELDPTTVAGTGFAANGNVLLRRGAEYQVEGEDLSIAAGTRELRVGGPKARIIYAGICLNGKWLRLDPLRMTVDSSPGMIHVDPVLLRVLGRSAEQPAPPTEEPQP